VEVAMPLIRGIRAWFSRRLDDNTMLATSAADGGASLGSASWLWFIALVVFIPVLAVLVLIGLIYELVIRIDGKRLGSTVEWAVSSALAIALLVGAYWVFLRR
jgi:hypothetical protein